MPTLAKVQDFVTAARRLLQDTVEVPPSEPPDPPSPGAPYRYSDADLIDALNLALIEARKVRPDLYVKTNFVVPSFVEADLTKDVPFNDMYRHAMVYFMVGYMQLRDDESTTDSRASALIGKFTGQLLTLS